MPYRFKVRQLRAYHALMETGSVTRAAEVLNLSQPTVSRQISLLEDAVGFELFRRIGGNKIVPTELGERFYQDAGMTLRGLEDLPNIAYGIQSNRKTRFKIFATHPILSADFFISALDKFCRENPEVQLRVEACTRATIESAIVARHADIGLAALPTEHPLLTVEELVRTEAMLAVPAGHRLAVRNEARLEDIANEVLLLDRGAPNLPHFAKFGRQWAVRKAVQLDIQLPATALRLVEIGHGVALVDPLAFDYFSSRDIRMLAWRPSIELSYGLFFQPDMQRSGEFTRLVRHLRREAAFWNGHISRKEPAFDEPVAEPAE